MTEIKDPDWEIGLDTLSPIQRFYYGKTIFVTGGSGFLGKILVEKLLRSCPGFKKLYLLIRPKKGKTAEERLKEILSHELFDKARNGSNDINAKVVAIPGDCSLPELGISDEDRKLLIKSVDVVFHAAATVRFEEKLKTAIEINVLATQDIVDLCKSMINLEALIHVSTAYSFCYLKTIGEEVYNLSAIYEKGMKLKRNVTQEELEAEMSHLLVKWPNTYTFTKAMAENILKKVEGRLPVCIFRPAIVTSTYAEPVPGWVDSMLGPTGLVLAAGCGVVRAVHCDKNAEANIVPSDLVINAMLALGKETSECFQNNEKNIKVYNFGSSRDNPLSFNGFMSGLEFYGCSIPPSKAIWYYSLTLCGSRSLTILLCLVLHLLPAIVIDAASVLSGKKPEMTKLYTKVHKMIRTLSYFATNKWDFETNNIKLLWNNISEVDKKMFNFDVKSIEWNIYLKSYFEGVRLYLLKEDLSTVPAALKRFHRLYWYHQMLKLTFGFLFLTVLWYGIQKLVSTFM